MPFQVPDVDGGEPNRAEDADLKAQILTNRALSTSLTFDCVSAMRTDAHQLTLCEVRSDFVSELCHIPPETLGQHRHLRGYVDAHRG
jgi:hypothetical protein